VTEPARERSGLLDTSTVILLTQLSNPEQLPEEPLISAITLAELGVGPLIAKDPIVRSARQAQLQQAEADFDPLPFDASAARSFARVAADLRGVGRKPAARAYDALIAAVAIANDLTLFTVNPTDFAGISELRVAVVPHPDHHPNS
jgi:predicted nucleic acid-binding protein